MSVADWSLLDRLPDATLVVAADGTLIAANDRARALLELDEDAVGTRPAAVEALRSEAGGAAARSGAGGATAPLAVTSRDGPDGTIVLALRPVATPPADAELVAAVAHDLRSPLASVKGFTRTLLRRWDRFSDEQKHGLLTTIEQDADRVARLLTTLVDVARLDAGRLRPHRAPVDLAGLAGTVVRDAADADTGRVRVEAADDLPAVEGDADRLERVLAELVDNALTFAPDGPVTVSLAADPDGHVHVRVADRGPGVPADVGDELFGRFVRGPDESRAGLGLGLYLVRGVVAAHGGRVWFDPDVEDGATVHVRLPAAG